MTAEQFDNHAWRKSDKVIYQDKEYRLYAVHFVDREVLIMENGSYSWIHHSEIELVNK